MKQTLAIAPPKSPTALDEVPGGDALIDACRRGERAALDVLLRRHTPSIERTLARLVGHAADRQDLLQRTLILAVRQFPTFRGESRVSTWLIGIAVNVARDHVRSGARQKALELLPSDAQLAQSGSSPEHVLRDRQLLGHIERHLSALSPKKRFAYILGVLEGHPVEEVARMLSVPVMTAKSRIFLARRELRQRMRKDPALAESLLESSL
ncbi:MAG: sigma-70 family RNA polymerase sigma factor [Polyangiaceae bacterium]|nr:sigma-70 family RNA polymerase sigma factor [Polyangiaceae bacterium]